MSKLPSTYNQYNQQGLNGFFSWIKKAVKAVSETVRSAMALDFTAVFDDLIDLFDGDGFFNGQDLGNIIGAKNFSTDLEITPIDEANLDNWLNNNFIPYYRNIFNQLNAFNGNLPSVEDFIIFYNNASMFMGYLTAQQNFESTNGAEGLTRNAVLTRGEFLTIQTTALRRGLDDFIATNALELSTRRVNLNIDTQKYTALGFNSEPVMNIRFAEVFSVNGVEIEYTEVDPSEGPGQGSTNIFTGNNGLIIKVLGAVASGYVLNRIIQTNKEKN